jgi:molecular chaperone GrpE
MTEPSYSDDLDFNPMQPNKPDPNIDADSDNPTENDFVIAPDGSLEELQQRLAEAEKQTLLAQADLENFRRRTRRDVQDQLRYAPIPLMSEILEAVDNLNRAIESHERDPNSEGLVEGMKMVAQQLAATLANHGCSRIESVGQPFDPTRHQAVQMQATDQHPPNTVIADLRPGYMLHDRVIRPAQVFVSTQTQ